MDFLSVSASVLGVLGAAANVSKILTKLVISIKGAPKLAHNILMEVIDISACLTQLQTFLLGTTLVHRSRTTLIMVEQLVVTLTSCVLVFSELEEMIDSLKTDLPMRNIDRLRWAMKENSIVKILSRLQTSKGSLNLLITTLTCSSTDEANNSVRDLSKLVEQVLAENREMSRRLKNLELESRVSLSRRVSTHYPITEADDDRSILTTRSQIDERAKSQDIIRTTTFGFAFDQDLNESRVYNRALYRRSNLSLPSTGVHSYGWSFLSGISLAQVSNISVISLPISVNELWNHQHYLPKTKHLIKHKGLPSLMDNGPMMTAKCLLLGSEKAGKSTIQKHFQIKYTDGFNNNDRIESRVGIIVGLNIPFRRFLHALEKKESPVIGLSTTRLKHYQEIALNDKLPTEYLTALKRFTQYHGRDQFVRLEDELVYNDNVSYFMNKIESIRMPTYTPTNEDILRSYVPTAGISQSEFMSSQVKFQIFDTAGNSSERRKWTSYFNERDYNVLMFVVAISEYDEYVGDTNRISTAVKVFEKLTKEECFENVLIILFLNKMDIFKEEINRLPVSAYFTDFSGGSDYDLACEYFADEFRKVDNRPKPNVHVFFTDATDERSFQSHMPYLEALIVQHMASTLT